MTMYKVTIHEHIIYDRYISAPSMQLAIEAVEEEVVSEDKGKWRQDCAFCLPLGLGLAGRAAQRHPSQRGPRALPVPF